MTNETTQVAAMKLLTVLCILPLACLSCPRVITRPEWNARLPENGHYQCMAIASKNVLIHHTYVPKICMDTNQCKQDMKSMQAYHQDTRKWSDIGYNFCIGGDGEVYEGRGWGVVGYPSKGYEFNSTNICFIGDYMKSLPTNRMFEAAVKLIDCGIREGFIEEDPRVLGIREVIPTQSPGDALQLYISSTRLGYKKNVRINNEIN